MTPADPLPAATAPASDASLARRGFRSAATASVVAFAATWWLAGAWRPLPLLWLAEWIVLGLVVLPCLFVTALAAVAGVLSLLLTSLALPFVLVGRPTGLLATLRELWALPLSLLPRFVSAVRRVDRPRLWGTTLGFVAGIGAFVARNGFGPPPG